MHDLEVVLSDARSGESKLATEIKELARGIKDKEKLLEKITPEFQAIVASETELSERLDQQQRAREEFFRKQANGKNFRSQAERDKHLQGQIKDLKQAITEKKAPSATLKKELADQEKLCLMLTKEKTDREGQLTERRISIDQVTQEHTAMCSRRDQLSSERKEFWRAEAALDRDCKELKSLSDQGWIL